MTLLVRGEIFFKNPSWKRRCLEEHDVPPPTCAAWRLDAGLIQTGIYYIAAAVVAAWGGLDHG